MSLVLKQCNACLCWVSRNSCFDVQGWLTQIHQLMQLLPPTMRLCWRLCCQCLPVRLSWRVSRLAQHQHLPLLAEGFLTPRLVITVGKRLAEVTIKCTLCGVVCAAALCVHSKFEACFWVKSSKWALQKCCLASMILSCCCEL